MSSFRLEELLPEVASGPVRLPRRQAGNSPQSMTVTLLADYNLRHRAWLPSAAVVDLLGEFGLSTAAARTTISRLARRGVLESSRRSRQALYRLTEPAAVSLASGGQTIAAFTAEAESWDGRWTLITFSLPQDSDSQRRTLRNRLRWLGYAPLYDAVWISPHDFTDRTAKALNELSLGAMTVFRTEQIPLPAARNPLDAWDIDAIAAEYDGFVEQWQPVLRQTTGGSLHAAEAVWARTQIMDSYRRFVALDPWLPTRLMPPGWQRAYAREIFATIYDGLAGPALEHVHHVIQRHTHDPLSRIRTEVRTHTVADLHHGLRRPEPSP